MSRILSIFALCFSLIAAACTTPSPVDSNASGVYRIRNADKVQFRMLDSVNALRQAAGRAPVQLNAQLNAAAATHSQDMSLQNRPWHFGSDGSSPLERVARTGYPGALVGEAISETYENEVQTLTAWMEDPATRSIVLDPNASNMGFFWFQESNGKLWWTMVMGS